MTMWELVFYDDGVYLVVYSANYSELLRVEFL